MSPRTDYLAILTSNTIHIAVLPSPEELTSRGGDTLRPKTYQLGPTAHVSENKPIAAALWHPLGQQGNCLVTVTEDGIVRLWELYENNRASFSEPTLSFDLRKLANASSTEENLRASLYKPDAGREFTPDSFEMEVASACFGGSGRYGEAPWASMTLWIAMKGGDVYALCPLLPSKWQPPSSIIPALSDSVKVKTQEQETEGEDWSQEDIYTFDMQVKWVRDIENQDPLLSSTAGAFSDPSVYKRPARPGPIPKLQGPFIIDPEGDTDFELTDIYVTGLKAQNGDEDPIDEFDGPDFQEQQESSGAMVCLLTSNARVLVCLDLDGVEAKWLPQRSSSLSLDPLQLEGCTQSLLLLDTISLTSDSTVQTCNPSFTPDIHSSYAFFITQDLGVSFVSLKSWLDRLAEELADISGASPDFRVNLLLNEDRYPLEQPLKYSQHFIESEADKAAKPVSAVVLEDSDVGYMLISSANGQPYACTFDTPNSLALAEDLGGLALTSDEPDRLPEQPIDPPRPPYQPAQAFYSDLESPYFIERSVPERHKRILNDEIKLSDAAMNIMVDAHRVAQTDSDALQEAVSELYRRCERMVEEWRDIIKRAAECNSLVDSVVGEGVEDEWEERGRDGNGEMDEGTSTRDKVARRLDAVRRRQEDLSRRYEEMRRKMRGVSGKELSDKERAWAEEIRNTSRDLGVNVENEEDDGDERVGESKLSKRFEDVKKLGDELVKQGEAIAEQAGDDLGGSRELRVPEGLRKQAVQRVQDLLDRESALVERVAERVEVLTMRTTS